MLFLGRAIGRRARGSFPSFGHARHADAIAPIWSAMMALIAIERVLEGEPLRGFFQIVLVSHVAGVILPINRAHQWVAHAMAGDRVSSGKIVGVADALPGKWYLGIRDGKTIVFMPIKTVQDKRMLRVEEVDAAIVSDHEFTFLYEPENCKSYQMQKVYVLLSGRKMASLSRLTAPMRRTEWNIHKNRQYHG